MTELELAYTILTNVFRSAKLYSKSLGGRQSSSLGSFKEVVNSGNLLDIYSNHQGHKVHENLNATHNNEEIAVTHDELADVCLVLSGQRPTDEHLEQMFEEAATFQASVPGSGNTENVQASDRSPRYGSGRSLSPYRVAQHNGTGLEDSDKNRNSMQHQKWMNKEHNNSGKMHVNGDSFDRTSDNSISMQRKQQHDNASQHSLNARLVKSHNHHSSFNLQGSLKRMPVNAVVPYGMPDPFSGASAQKQTKFHKDSHGVGGENPSSEQGSTKTATRSHVGFESTTPGNTNASMSLSSLVAGSHTFRTFLLELATDDIYCALSRTQLGKVRAE